MVTFFKLKYKLRNGEKIAESFYVESKTRDGSPFFKMDETFMNFKIRMEWALGMKNVREDWKKVLWRKEEENDSEWKPFLVSDEKESRQGGIHKEHAFFMFY